MIYFFNQYLIKVVNINIYFKIYYVYTLKKN